MKRWVRWFRGPHSIRSRFVLLVLAIFIPALLVGWWVVSLTHQLALETNQRRLEDTSRAISRVLDLELAQRAAVVRGLALSRLLETAPHIPQSSLLAFDDQARRTLTGAEGWLEVRTTNQLLIDTRLPPGNLPPTTATLTAGTLVDTARIQPLRQNTDQGTYHASLVQPVLRQGQPVLNLTLTLLPREFQRIIDQQKFDKDWVAGIVDSEGRVVARHPRGEVHTGRYTSSDLRERLSRDREGLMHTKSLDGKDVALYFNTTAQGWTYVIAMPEAQFNGVVPEDVRNLALGTMGLLTFAVLAALWLSRGIARPIQTIKQLALDMKSGQPVRANKTAITECNEVADAMAQASQSIHAAQVEMERRVEQAIVLTRNTEEHLSRSQRLEALGRLTGGVAHDFNNLLGVISNSSHLLLRKTQDPALTSPVEATLRAVEAGSRLTQHLLRFAGRQSVRPELITLGTFLPEAAELVRSLLGRRIQLTVVIDPSAPTVFADPSELELSLFNLALNARDAMVDSGHVELRSARADADDGAGLPEQDFVVISLTDDGSGISDAIAKRVFEPFFSTKASPQASGLGLSQVYGFCRQSGGTARINSTPGLGTTVNMILPARSTTGTPPSKPFNGTAPSITGTRVLLVEDNDELRGVTSSLLASFGCEVVPSASAQEALRILQNNSDIDAMLTDVLMPGPMDGVSLARQVRQQFPGVSIVLISGHRGDADGRDDFPFVQKPCEPEALVAVLADAMAQRKAPVSRSA
ncbi:response regulator [Hydrogenophaga sp. A37]|uniref:response regulator n=1 Tax=Hydrogenophaga sp. A37 TaxID=1945864 RepID=UPI0009C69D96|nr:response regulator [Hydrogenophaga sp. A37]OOG80916.1 hypothetical protein B0E41_19495 [Hydrogenophaga sp. A37]